MFTGWTCLHLRLQWLTPFSQVHPSPWLQGIFPISFQHLYLEIPWHTKISISKLNSISTHKPKPHSLKESLVQLSESQSRPISPPLTLLIQLVTTAQGCLWIPLFTSPPIANSDLSVPSLICESIFLTVFINSSLSPLSPSSRLLPKLYFQKAFHSPA